MGSGTNRARARFPETVPASGSRVTIAATGTASMMACNSAARARSRSSLERKACSARFLSVVSTAATLMPMIRPCSSRNGIQRSFQ